jgi:hypothetical protein
VPLVGLVVLAAVFAVLGGSAALWSAVLLVVGPLGCLLLTVRRPVREWTRARRPPGGRRKPARSR